MLLNKLKWSYHDFREKNHLQILARQTGPYIERAAESFMYKEVAWKGQKEPPPWQAPGTEKETEGNRR